MPGIIEIIAITRQHFGTIPTYCRKCGKSISFKIVKENGSYTQLCDCGCTIFQHHDSDQFHKTAFFTRDFISKQKYDPEFKNKDEIEKAGFKKIEESNGKKVYAK